MSYKKIKNEEMIVFDAKGTKVFDWIPDGSHPGDWMLWQKFFYPPWKYGKRIFKKRLKKISVKDDESFTLKFTLKE